MKCVFVSYLFSFPLYSLSAQTHILITGKVLDRKSSETLSYANISIRGSSLGTVTNGSGEFEFYVPEDLKEDTLMISYIGYRTFKEKISSLTELKVFLLEESPIVLSEITVSSEGARKLVEEAMKAIPLVYPTTPYLLEGFHRSWERVDFTDSIRYPGTLIEAAVTIYDPGYGQKKSATIVKEEIYINEVRRSAVMKFWGYGGNILKELLDKNLIKYNRAIPFIFLKSFLDFPNNLIYEWAGVTSIDGEILSVVKIEVPNTQKFPAFYTVYISEVDHAILRFDLYGTKREIDYTLGPWHTENFNETYIFKRYQHKPYLSYVKKQYTIKKLHPVKRNVLQTEEYYRELLISNVITANVEGQRKSLSGRKSKENSLALQAKEYNETFWKNYNVIKENPLDLEIIAYFEQKRKPENLPKTKTKK